MVRPDGKMEDDRGKLETSMQRPSGSERPEGRALVEQGGMSEKAHNLAEGDGESKDAKQ